MTTKTREQIRAEREALDAQERQLLAGELNAVREKIEEMASGAGMSFDAFVTATLLGQGHAKRKSSDKPRRNVMPPKYENPNNPSDTWSGAGKAPGWFGAAINHGYAREDMEIGRTRASASNGQARA